MKLTKTDILSIGTAALTTALLFALASTCGCGDDSTPDDGTGSTSYVLYGCAYCTEGTTEPAEATTTTAAEPSTTRGTGDNAEHTESDDDDDGVSTGVHEEPSSSTGDSVGDSNTSDTDDDMSTTGSQCPDGFHFDEMKGKCKPNKGHDSDDDADDDDDSCGKGNDR